jgi:hypothetical protein
VGGEYSDCRDEESRACAGAIVEPDLPTIFPFIEAGCGDIGVERDVAPQVKLVGYVVEVALVLRLPGKVLLPIPLLQQFLRKRVTIAVTLGIETRARVAVPIPCPAHSAACLENPNRQPELPKTNQLEQSGNPSADDDRVELPDGSRLGGRRGLQRIFHLLFSHAFRIVLEFNLAPTFANVEFSERVAWLLAPWFPDVERCLWRRQRSRGVSRRVSNPCFPLVAGRSRLTFVSFNGSTNRPHEREKRKRGHAVRSCRMNLTRAIVRIGCAMSRSISRSGAAQNGGRK